MSDPTDRLDRASGPNHWSLMTTDQRAAGSPDPDPRTRYASEYRAKRAADLARGIVRSTTGTEPLVFALETPPRSEPYGGGIPLVHIHDERGSGQVYYLDEVLTALEVASALATCPHESARVVAYLSPAAGLPWQYLEHDEHDEHGPMTHALTTLGECGECGADVVSVRTWDAENWTPEHGPAWTGPWTRLVPDGQQL
jgi:hypothetical protein